MANKLKGEQSFYLRQHGDNPVEWRAYNQESLEEAKRENKLIFLSIGYSTCHWCHVMERESFKNEEIAALLNREYISIKIDREEMPDIDKYYQDAYQLMHRRSGGWPLTILLTPDQGIIFSATYLPPQRKGQMRGVDETVTFFANQWREKSDKLTAFSHQMREAMQGEESLPSVMIDGVFKTLKESVEKVFSKEHGGFSGAPKFPREGLLNLLLDASLLKNDDEMAHFALFTLKKMIQGGIYDQIEGGVYRYSVDERWEIPHFEKMLYNQAMTVEALIKAYHISGDSLFKEKAIETAAFIEKKFMKENLFFSASNADSEGEEGKYYVYSYEESFKVLEGLENREALLDYFGITKEGNFENATNNPKITSEAPPTNAEEAKRRLFSLREKRVYPFIDQKILTAWNAMWISTLFELSAFSKTYLDQARESLKALLQKVLNNEVLYHQYVQGYEVDKRAVLEDYAFVIRAKLQAYRYTHDQSYLDAATSLYQKAETLFFDKKWFHDQEKKIKADVDDNSYYAAKSIMIHNAITLSTLESDLEKYENTVSQIREYGYYLMRYPHFYTTLTSAYLRYLYKDIVIKAPSPIHTSLYPYTLSQKSDVWMLCTIEKCFASPKEEIECEKAIKTYSY